MEGSEGSSQECYSTD